MGEAMDPNPRVHSGTPLPFNSVVAQLGAAAPRSAWITTLLTSIARCREALPLLSLGPS